ncbi:hypothetical protein Gotri_006318, partial [Gossypium trilobum]|nr:hypothetical protein [Gossypium trilobum]
KGIARIIKTPPKKVWSDQYHLGSSAVFLDVLEDHTMPLVPFVTERIPLPLMLRTPGYPKLKLPYWQPMQQSPLIPSSKLPPADTSFTIFYGLPS